MKKILNSLISVKKYSNEINTALLIARVGIASLMLVHGLPKLMMFFNDDPIAFANIGGMGPELSLFLAVFAEVFCSLLLLAGYRTRLAAIPLIITMLIAVFQIHANDPFSIKEMGLHYLLVYVLLFILGSGMYSVDNLLEQSKLRGNPSRNVFD